MTSASVRQAASLEDMNHREPAFAAMCNELRTRLLSVYEDTKKGWVPYLLGGSGTAAVEATISSCLAGTRCLVISNGYYSGRISDILAIHQDQTTEFRLDWDQRWTPEVLDRLRKTLRHGNYDNVIATHNETTFGRLNPIGQIAEICNSVGVELYVDAMSSFGADSLSFRGLSGVISSANKCLHGLPGLSFVLLRSDVAERIRNKERRTYYLHLPFYEGTNPPLTPPIPAMRSLLQALRENPDGFPSRAVTYQRKRSLIQDGLSDLGFQFAVPESESSVTLLSPTLPPNWSFDRWYEANYEAGFALYGVKPPFREAFFQVSVMGEVTDQNVKDWLAVVKSLI